LQLFKLLQPLFIFIVFSHTKQVRQPVDKNNYVMNVISEDGAEPLPIPLHALQDEA